MVGDGHMTLPVMKSRTLSHDQCLCFVSTKTHYSLFQRDFLFLSMTQILRGIVCEKHFILSPSLLHSLGGNRIHDNGASALAKVLCQNTTLEELE